MSIAPAVHHPLRIGIIGCGKIADGHAETIRYLPGAELVAACDREPILAEQLAVRFGIPDWYPDVASMLAGARLDVVHITTPPSSHLELTEQCVKAGLHVLLEKPLALNTVDAQKLVDIVTRANKLMTINYWPNFDPPAIKLKRLLSEGVLGEPVHVEAFIGYDLQGAYGQALMSDADHWVHKLPGKLFHNMMDHIFNRLVPFFGGTIPEVSAHAYKRRLSERGDVTDAMLDELRVYLQGDRLSAFGTLCSHARPVANTLKVYGTKSTAEVDFANRTVLFTTAQKYPSALGRLIPPFQSASRSLKAAVENLNMFRRHQFQFFAGMTVLLEHFYEAVRVSGSPPIPYDEILNVSRVMDMVIEQVYPKFEDSAR